MINKSFSDRIFQSHEAVESYEKLWISVAPFKASTRQLYEV